MNGFKYLKGIFERTVEKSTNTIRTIYDGTTVTGTFILSKSPANIYNRFKRKFGNKLKLVLLHLLSSRNLTVAAIHVLNLFRHAFHIPHP